MNGKTKAWVSGVAGVGMLATGVWSLDQAVTDQKAYNQLIDSIRGISDEIRNETTSIMKNHPVSVHVGFECNAWFLGISEVDCQRLEADVTAAANDRVRSLVDSVVTARVNQDPRVQALRDEGLSIFLKGAGFGVLSIFSSCGGLWVAISLYFSRRRRKEMLDKISEFSPVVQNFIQGLPEWKDSYDEGRLNTAMQNLIKYAKDELRDYEALPDEYKQALSLFSQKTRVPDTTSSSSIMMALRGYLFVWTRYRSLSSEQRERVGQMDLWKEVMNGTRLVTEYDFDEIGQLFLLTVE